MSEQAGQRELSDSLGDARARAGAEHYLYYQQRIRRGQTAAVEGARPMEFDESGFPLPQRNPSFVERVARLLNPL